MTHSACVAGRYFYTIARYTNVDYIAISGSSTRFHKRTIISDVRVVKLIDRTRLDSLCSRLVQRSVASEWIVTVIRIFCDETVKSVERCRAGNYDHPAIMIFLVFSENGCLQRALLASRRHSITSLAALLGTSLWP